MKMCFRNAIKNKAGMLLLLSLTTASCGARDLPDSVSGVEEGGTEQASSGQIRPESGETDADASTDGNGGIRAVADFHYLEMDSALAEWKTDRSYAINGDWLYVTDFAAEGEGTGDQRSDTEYFGITRERIADGFQEKCYAVTDVERMGEVNRPLLLADRVDNCYIFWRLYDREQEAEAYRLEKYGPQGDLLWRTEPDSGELEGMGDRLDQGTVTGDGRIVLYSRGADGCVFCYGTDGVLEAVYRPELESLDGVAAGADGRVYGYCVKGNETVFAELGGGEGQYACPAAPLAVYDGYEEGLLLRTGEGMDAWVPETGESRRLWEWGEEYLQLDSDSLEKVCVADGAFTLMCEIPFFTYGRQVLTFARVTFEDGGEYPARQVVTLTTDYSSPVTEFLVQMYNRQSRKYRVEMAHVGDGEALQKALLRGEGADLMEVGRIYTGDLARHGAFEDLDPYFENSSSLGKEDILASVGAACTVGGKNVTVIPGFTLQTMRARGDFLLGKDWTIWKFLELGEENRMLSSQSPNTALNYCMGIRYYGEHFIDYENKTCSFDGEEFRRILEACGRWETYTERNEAGQQVDSSGKNGEWIFDTVTIASPRDIVWRQTGGIGEQYEYYGEDYLATLAGYPGWEGGEYALQADSVFAVGSASAHKEGAWDFLEYILSEEAQARLGQMQGIFPVRKDSFREYLEDDYTDPDYSEPVTATEAEIRRVEEMAEAAVLDDYGVAFDPVWGIVSEEAGMYFSGDAALDATVKKIQTRVQLYLDEM